MQLEIITADEIPFKHGFFTRKGGASSGVYHGLNCGLSSGDQADMVQINRSRAAQTMGADITQMAGVYQVHGVEVAVVDGPPLTRPHADALVTARPGVVLTILTADCAPVLFADPIARVIGIAHAGWRGAFGGVIAATVAQMQSLGADTKRIQAVVGPCISQPHYEVGADFFERFNDEDHAHSRFFVNGEGGKYLFDLPGFALMRLREAGVGSARWTGHCTYSEPERFFSFRRMKHLGEADYGRLISCIKL